jgi:3',5'-cyclic AMP phosphodiesterase CpdA
MALSRRDLFAATAGAAVSRLGLPVAAPGQPLRFAHMNDFHIQPEARAGEGVAKAFSHMRERNPKVEFVFGGGDLVMAGQNVEEARMRVQMDLLQRTLKEGMDRPFYPVIGNHDIWGWNKAGSKTTGNEPLWGKRWFQDAFELASTNFAFEKGGWKFVVLDTVQPKGTAYEGLVDDAQLDWLKGQVAGTTPCVIVSHIPLFAPGNFVHAWNEEAGQWRMGANMQVRNFLAVKEVFDRQPNVKLALSAHTHLLDRYDLNGVAYLNNGAVCGNWWRGRYRDFDPGYVTIDLWPDGKWTHEFHRWGWTAE